jgi:hypothetical protein
MPQGYEPTGVISWQEFTLRVGSKPCPNMTKVEVADSNNQTRTGLVTIVNVLFKSPKATKMFSNLGKV